MMTQHKATLVNVILYSWYEIAPDEAIKWVVELPKGPLRDRSLSRLAIEVSKTDKQKARTLAAQLGNEKMRTQLLNQ